MILSHCHTTFVSLKKKFSKKCQIFCHFVTLSHCFWGFEKKVFKKMTKFCHTPMQNFKSSVTRQGYEFYNSIHILTMFLSHTKKWCVTRQPIDSKCKKSKFMHLSHCHTPWKVYTKFSLFCCHFNWQHFYFFLYRRKEMV